MKNESADLSLFFNRKKVLIVPLSLKPLVGASYVSFAAIFQITAHSLRCASSSQIGTLGSAVRL